MQELFFPELKRRDNYLQKEDGGFYADYKKYHEEIAEDCLCRCVYCDIETGEMGGEGMQLDHFYPQEKFPDKSNNPSNLVLACPKCNRLKWNHWPCAIDSGENHDGRHGFIEPFDEDRRGFFTVEESGELTSLKGPAQYMVDLLYLNRLSRMQIRRKRIIDRKACLLADRIDVEMQGLAEKMDSGAIEGAEAVEILESLIDSHKELRGMIAV